MRYRLKKILPPLPKVRCPKNFKIQNPWGKVMERIDLTFEKILLIKGLKGSGGYKTRIRRFYQKESKLYHKYQEVISRIFVVLVLLSASVE